MALWSWHLLDDAKWRGRLPSATSKLRELWRTERSFRFGVGFGILAVLFIFPTLAAVFLLAALAALLGLFLQTALQPSPLSWTVPWEVVQLLLDRRARTNHVWNHRVQSLLRERKESPSSGDGFADAEGFFLLADDLNEAQVQQFAQMAWDELVQQADEKPLPGCKTIRFLLTALLCAGGTMLLQIWREVEFPAALLSIVLSIGVAAILAPGTEKLLGRWMETRAWQEEKAGTNRVHVRRFEIPGILFFRGGNGYWVRRIAAGLAPENEIAEGRASAAAEQLATAGKQSVPAPQLEPQIRTEQKVKAEELEPWVV